MVRTRFHRILIAHEIERSCPTPELSSINITLQIPASTTREGTLADGEKAFMQGDPSVRDEPLYATPPPEVSE